MNSPRNMLLTATLAGLVPLLVLAQPADDGQAERLRRVEQVQATHPQQWAKLRHNLAVWQSLAPERQAALRQLDEQLHAEPLIQRNRCERALERYADWLERLPTADRQHIQEAADRKTRLQRIRAVKDRQWLQRLPKGQAERLAKAAPAEHAELKRKWQQEERDDRLDWHIALRNPLPVPLKIDALPKDTREFVEKGLLPLLSKEEEKQLRDAEGRWPRFPRLLIELADNHPLALLGPIGPTTIKDLPPNPFLLTVLEKDKRIKDRLQAAEGRWPEFGVVLRDLSQGPIGKKLAGPTLAKSMPARLDAFPPAVQEFVTEKLVPILDREERFQLEKADDWPAYPQTVLLLARQHNLLVPAGHSRLDFLDRYRARPLLPASVGLGRRGELPWLPQ